MDKLSRYMSEARERALPDEVVEKAKHHILDTLAAMISGSEIRPGRAAIEFVRAYGGKEVATVVLFKPRVWTHRSGTGERSARPRRRDGRFHGPSRSHPGVSVIPAALAAGELFGISGTHFLRAVTLGYDVGTRVTMSMGGPGYQVATPQEHTRDRGGLRGRCGRRLRRESWSSADAFAAGLQRSTTSELEPGAGMRNTWRRLPLWREACAGGVTAAMLVRAGWTGVDDIFLLAPDAFKEIVAGQKKCHQHPSSPRGPASRQ